ncbi:MAG: sporulation integral membrane protein YlbJ [Firmicutes bacterium]|jgi:sporulation integral membrane protein YlbJ|nr:sporulation integral membrane protein YlbJ [Bacillota bacterium]
MAKKKQLGWSDRLGAFFTVAACVLLLWDPKEAIQGGLQGLQIFGEIVLPSLLPFFVASEILIGLGIVHFLGALVEPLMRPVFDVPGVGSFVWSMGLAAGYPMDAVITAKLRNSGDCTRVEGERLLAFTNTADPLFLLGAVAVGMLGLPAVGGHLAAAHYISAISVGIIFRFYGRHESESPAKTVRQHEKKEGYLQHAWEELYRAREQDGRPLGKLLADAMADSTETLTRVGGFIMFFAALIRLLDSSGVLQWLCLPLGWFLSLFGWEKDLSMGLVAGLLELDVGSAMVASVPAPLVQRLAVMGAIVGWSGLSVHGQVASIISSTDLRMSAYIKARLLHALLAAFFTAVLMWLRPPVVTTAAGVFTAVVFSPLFRLITACSAVVLTVMCGMACHWLCRR